MLGTAGNTGDAIRSDCFVSLRLTNTKGIQIDLKSRVAALYGNSIRNRCIDILNYFEIRNAELTIDDHGALDFVIAARLESAIKEVIPSEKEYLLPIHSENIYTTDKDTPRRSRLYLPGNSPKLMINAGIHAADGIILDLEDSVSPDKKKEARFLIRNALRSIDFCGAERMVRINQLPEGIEDLKFILSQPVNLILIPKCETAGQIEQINIEITQTLEGQHKPIYLMPIIESGLGVINAYQIASASDNIVALAIGLEDYTADIGVSRTEEGGESVYARSAIVNAAAAAGIQAIDSVYSDVSNMSGLKDNVARSKALGFVGMGCIHPRQIPIINSGFDPEFSEIKKAKAIVRAFEEAKEKGLGVIALGSKMIDLPVVKRAGQTIDLAIKSGLIQQNWREEGDE